MDSRVEVLDPIDGHIEDAVTGAIGKQQQLGVEEPRAVADMGQQLTGDV